jgi:peptidoglycan hydrolase-like protein with peptidoglycan-binding domain
MPSTIKQGSKGKDVQLAQYELCRSLYLGGPADVDGDFGPHTDAAVREYQSANQLTVDGIVGPHTWTSMLNLFPDPPILAKGSQWPHVNRLQHFLNGAEPPANPHIAEDDIFGPKTESAVKHYQAAHSVPADGIVGYKTWVVHVGAANAMVASVVGV